MPLLQRVLAYCREHNLTERQFGVLALNDKNFVSDVRAGRSPSLNTVERLRRFMSTYPNHDRAAA
jgi:hypothetical protein